MFCCAEVRRRTPALPVPQPWAARLFPAFGWSTRRSSRHRRARPRNASPSFRPNSQSCSSEGGPLPSVGRSAGAVRSPCRDAKRDPVAFPRAQRSDGGGRPVGSGAVCQPFGTATVATRTEHQRGGSGRVRGGCRGTHRGTHAASICGTGGTTDPLNHAGLAQPRRPERRIRDSNPCYRRMQAASQTPVARARSLPVVS